MIIGAKLNKYEGYANPPELVVELAQNSCDWTQRNRRFYYTSGFQRHQLVRFDTPEEAEMFILHHAPQEGERIWSVNHHDLLIPGDDGGVQIKAYGFCVYDANHCLDVPSGNGNGAFSDKLVKHVLGDGWSSRPGAFNRYNWDEPHLHEVVVADGNPFRLIRMYMNPQDIRTLLYAFVPGWDIEPGSGWPHSLGNDVVYHLREGVVDTRLGR